MCTKMQNEFEFLLTHSKFKLQFLFAFEFISNFYAALKFTGINNIFFFNRATENINNESKRIDEDAQQDSVPPMKKRRSTPNGDPMKILGNISQTFRELVNQVLISKEEQTELDLYFSSICKTVKKLDALEQVKIKMQISQIVNQAELEQLSHSKQNDASTILGNNSTSNQNNSSSHFMNHSVNQNNSSHIRMNQMYPNMN